MKKAASIVSWIGGIITILFTLIIIGRGYNVVKIVPTMYGYRREIIHHAFPLWVWIITILFIIADIIVLFYRESAVMNGNKVLAGVLTIIFASKLGGIFTLCIPENELYGRRKRKGNTRSGNRIYASGYINTSNDYSKLSPLERADALKKLEDEYDMGLIDTETYQKKRKYIEDAQ